MPDPRRTRGRPLRAVGLPFLVALSPEITPLPIPGPDLAAMVWVAVLPPVGSLVRAHPGGVQLRGLSQDRPAWGRQAFSSAAILTREGCEVPPTSLICGKVRLFRPWLAAGTAYLCLVLVAPRPAGSHRPAR